MAVRTIYIELRASAERLKADLVEVNSNFANVGKSGAETGRQISSGINTAHESFGKFVRDTTEAGLALESVAKVAARYSGAAAVASGSTNTLVNTYRALRIALDPTPFTVAAVATGILIESTLKLVNARAKLIEQQSLIAALSQVPIKTVERFDAASGISGANSGAVRSLYSTLQARSQTNAGEVKSGMGELGISGEVNPDSLAKIAAAFSSIEDPVKRADAAVLLFGSDAGTALDQLNSHFASADAAVKRNGLVLDELSRVQIYHLHQEFKSLGDFLTDFSMEKGWWEGFKNGTLIMAGAADDMSNRAMSSFDELIRRIPGLQALAGAMQNLKTLSPAELKAPAKQRESEGQGLTADDLFAQAQAARARHSTETLEGLRAEQAKQKALADDLYKQLEDDQNKRKADPNDKTLLTPEARLTLTTRQQSASQQSTNLGEKVTSTEAAQKVRDEDNLTAAIGRGYQAKRAASIENQLSIELAEKGGNAADLRARLEAQYDAEHRHEIAEAIQGLQDQIKLEQTQAAFQEVGAEAVRRATLEVRLAKQALNGATAEQIKLERAADAAKKENSDAAAIAGIEQRIQATERLTEAISQGPGAVHTAELANKYDEMDRSGKGAQVPATKVADATDRKKSDTEEADALERKIALTERLTVATKEGEAAVARVTLENSMADIERGSSGDKGQLQHLTQLLDAAEKRKKAAEDQAAAEKTAQDAAAETNRKLDRELEAVKRLAAAVGQGAEARRRAEQENKFAEEAKASEDTPVPGVTGVTQEELKRRGIENIATTNRVTTEALDAGGGQQEKLRALTDQLSKLNDVKVTSQNVLDIETARNALNERILEAEIAQGQAVGASVGSLQLQLAAMQAMDQLRQWKSIGPGSFEAAGINTAMQAPQALGGALATGIFDTTGGHGADVGKQVGEAMKGLGKQLLGDLITDALKRILAELVLQTGLQTALNALLPAATAAGGVAGGGIAAAGSLAAGAAGAAGSAASTAASGLVGPLISAAGGIIGGVISAVATWIGDNKIVKAVDGTTAAVNALADKFSGFGQTNTAGTLASTQSALTAQPGTTAQPGQSPTTLLQSILGITPESLTTTSLVQSLFGVTFGPGAAGGRPSKPEFRS